MLSGASTVKLSSLKLMLGNKSLVPILTKWAKEVGILNDLSKEELKRVFTLVSFGDIVKTLKKNKNSEIYVSANWLRSIGAIKNEFK